MFKLDAPTIIAIGGMISTWLGMILGYLGHKNAQLAKVRLAQIQAPAPATLAPLPPAPSSGPLAAATAPHPGYGSQ